MKDKEVLEIPADCEISLSGKTHGQEGGPGHEDVLERIPEVGEDVGVEVKLYVEDLDTGVVPDAGGDICNV